MRTAIGKCDQCREVAKVLAVYEYPIGDRCGDPSIGLCSECLRGGMAALVKLREGRRSVKPTIGRIVHYHCLDSLNSGPVAAIVTHAYEDDSADLALFWHASAPSKAPTEMERVPCAAAAGGAAEFWTWPSREEGDR